MSKFINHFKASAFFIIFMLSASIAFSSGVPFSNARALSNDSLFQGASSLAAAPAPPSDVVLGKDGNVLTVSWVKSSTPDVKYKVEIMNRAGGIAYSVDNLSSDTSDWVFSNVNANNYTFARVYSIDGADSSFADSNKGVYTQLLAINDKSSFSDLQGLNNESKSAINWAYVYGIANGFSSTIYKPSNIITREQMTGFLHRLAGRTKNYDQSNPFKDIGKSSFQYDIKWAFRNGLTFGTSSSKFSPKRGVTRGQMALFLYRLASKPSIPISTTAFSDIGGQNPELQTAIKWLESQDITSGIDPSHFAPNQKVTRNQMVLFLKRYSDILALCPFLNSDAGGSDFFTTKVTRDSITSLSFLDSAPACSNPYDLTDANLSPGAIIACVNGSQIQVGQRGGVIANPDTSEKLFWNLRASGLKLDISTFDAFNTENMQSIFEDFVYEGDLILPKYFG
ncbi:MAG: S-layer homology domain-containing protein, partial [Bifidobacteriaceae bacterium]|nr:S-layer homology domain-containing protein [Bifidobacteriaceae bacterium]